MRLTDFSESTTTSLTSTRRQPVTTLETWATGTDTRSMSALAANAEGAQWGIDTGVYVPTTEEMDAADALNGAFSGVEVGYGKVNSLATARRIAESLAAYEETRKDATII